MTSTRYLSDMSKRFHSWEVTAIILCALISGVVIWIEFQCDCLTTRYPLFYSGVLGLASGVVGTVIILWLQRWHRAQELHSRYQPLAGMYVRKDIGQDNASDQELVHMKTENNGLSIELTYEGENAFSVTVNYWKSEKAVVKAHIEFIESNKMVATGRYRYLDGNFLTGHFGTYTVYRADQNGVELLVQFQHLFPRSQATNPDRNRGWEVWAKT